MSADDVVAVVDPPPVAAGEPRPGAGDRPARRRRRSGGWWAAGRLARLELRHRPARTALVIALVAVPVAGMAVGTVFSRTAVTDAAEVWRQQNGAADATTDRPVDGVPADFGVAEVRSVAAVLRTTAGQRAAAVLSDVPLLAPITNGMVHVEQGRPPAGADEVLLAPALADELGVGIGDTLALERPERMDLTVTGLGVDRDQVRDGLVVVGPGRHIEVLARARPRRLVDVPDGMGPDELAVQIARWRLIVSPAMNGGVSVPDDSGTNVLTAVLIGAVALTAAGIVIAAAFATGARRQLTTIGLLSANGAPPALIRRVMQLQGVAAGLAGTVVGFVFAAAVLVVMRTRLDLFFRSYHDGLRAQWTDFVVIAAIAVAVATVAAAVPARVAAGVPVTAALAGRRPVGAVPRSLTLGGLGAIAAGLALIAVPAGARPSDRAYLLAVAGGVIAVMLGMVALTPALVSVTGRLGARGLSRMGSRLRGPWRVAARSLARQRTHASAMVAAVCACAALTVAASAAVVGQRYSDPRALPEIPPDQVVLRANSPDMATRPVVPADAVARMRTELPEAEVIPLTAVGPAPSDRAVAEVYGRYTRADGGPPAFAYTSLNSSFGFNLMLADETALALYAPDAHARAALDATGALAVGPDAGRTTGGSIALGNTSKGLEPQVNDEFAISVVTGEHLHGLTGALITPARAAELGFVTRPGPIVLRTPQPLDEGQRAAVETLPTDPTWIRGAWPEMSRPQVAVRRSVLAEAGLAAGCLLVTLLVIAAGLALTAAESRAERDLLALAGADPRVLARVAARKAVLIAALGAVLAVPVGLVPAFVLVLVGGSPSQFAFPWRTILVLVVVVPVLAGLAARVTSGLAQRRRPVRLSTMAFE